jgi:hypothetical protein
MVTKTAMAIAEIKQKVRLTEWAEQIQSQMQSGLSVRSWCAQNGINPKTYYYRLRRVCEECVEAAPAVVPLNVPKQSGSINIVKNDLQISLPADISSDTLVSLVHELC